MVTGHPAGLVVSRDTTKVWSRSSIVLEDFTSENDQKVKGGAVKSTYYCRSLYSHNLMIFDECKQWSTLLAINIQGAHGTRSGEGWEEPAL